MRILQICGGPSWGGMEMQTLLISKELREKGEEVHIFCSADSELEKHAIKDGVPCSAGLFDPGSGLFPSVKACKKLLRDFQPDIIHCQRSHDLAVISIALRRLGRKTPLLYTQRMESRYKKKTIVHRRIYSRVDRFFCVSSFVRENFLQTTPAKPAKTFVMNNGVDLKKFNPDRHAKDEMIRKFDLSEADLYIGMSGRISSMKGHKDFIEAASIISRKSNKKVSFVMAGPASVGEDGFAEEIYRFAKEKLSSNVYKFIDFQSDLSEILTALDIYVFPSHRESFGNVLIEAMAMKKAVVAVHAGGVSDIVSCGKDALCVKPQAPEEIAEAVLTFINNEEQRNEFAEAALKKAHTFSREVFVDNLLKEYQGFLSGKGQ
jgi:glycosyltransferase involved in cell wall biosynthesis